MKKLVLPVLTVIALLAAAAYVLHRRRDVKECAADKDCKLIYSNCDCAAVPAADPRASLDGGGAVCKWNLCIGRKTSAFCRAGRCVKSGE